MGKHAIPTQRCAHGFDFPAMRCDLCMDIADDERWVASEKRQIDAGQFALDMQSRELDRRISELTKKLVARAAVLAEIEKP